MPLLTLFNQTVSTPDPGEIGVVKNSINYYGERDVPQDVRRRRRSVAGAMRRVGSPILIKHMYNPQDVEDGIAVRSANSSSVYGGQTRNMDPLSHGIGFSSVQTSNTEWVSPNGQLVVSSTQPDNGYVPAPLYRGFGPGHLTYAILPDVSEDLFKLTTSGVLIKTQSAQVQMGWYPEVNDNDLIIVCRIDRNFNVVETYERFQAKQTSPVSVRGLDRRGRREYTEDFGNRHVINQSFEMSLIPSNNELMNVETDR